MQYYSIHITLSWSVCNVSLYMFVDRSLTRANETVVKRLRFYSAMDRHIITSSHSGGLAKNTTVCLKIRRSVKILILLKKSM